jgi:hypothetical protein
MSSRDKIRTNECFPLGIGDTFLHENERGGFVRVRLKLEFRRDGRATDLSSLYHGREGDLKYCLSFLKVGGLRQMVRVQATHGSRDVKRRCQF